MTRSRIDLITAAIPAARQLDARHYGVHPYFTRRPANVVRAYVERYSQVGDVVLDPFGGTGVTAVEAFLLGRQAIQNDLNPFANFLASTIADTSLHPLAPLTEAFQRVRDGTEKVLSEIETSEKEAERWLKRVELPANIALPRTSDAERFFDLFTARQLAGLAVLKAHIDREEAGSVRNSLLLAWSASVAKLNKTFLSAKGRAESRGGSSIFSIYRYKLAASSVELPLWATFEGRFRNVLAAKKEVLALTRYHRDLHPNREPLDSTRNFRVLSADAAHLNDDLPPHSVDYIFTDPPYGAFISYLDLSILWNHWLGFPVSPERAASETIVGGERGHSEQHYKDSLRASIRVACGLLRPDRWMSVVFQHWDVSYFETILDEADACGARLKAAITQTGDVIWSMHKKKNSASVLAGELILTFYKPRTTRDRRGPVGAVPVDPEAALSAAFDRFLSNGTSSYSSESIFNRLVIELWEKRALSCLNLDRRTFSHQLELRGWSYNPKSHLWTRGHGKMSPSSGTSLFER